MIGGGLVDGIDAIGTVTIEELTSDQATITVDLTNDSPQISGDDPRITAFGLSIDGYTNGNGSLSSPGGDLSTFGEGNFPGFGSNTGFEVVVCATSGNDCAGGGSGGIPSAGGSDLFTFVITGAFGEEPTLNLDAFAIKIQGGPDGASFEIPGVPSNGGGGGGEVPEPGTVLLLGSGIVGLGLRQWWKRAK